MARLYEGVAARMVGAAGGLLILVTGLWTYLFMGATASNVPLPAPVARLLFGLVPQLERIGGEPMALWAVALFGLLSLVLVGLGARNVLEALFEPDYTVRVTSSDDDFGP